MAGLSKGGGGRTAEHPDAPLTATQPTPLPPPPDIFPTVPAQLEFEADEDTVAVDGWDFLATVFQLGEPALARPALARAFGNAVLPYAERAWATDNQDTRIALFDLARHDPDVVKAHHANTVGSAGGLARFSGVRSSSSCPLRRSPSFACGRQAAPPTKLGFGHTTSIPRARG